MDGISKLTATAIAAGATLAMTAAAGAAGAQTVGWLTTNFGAATPVQSYGGGTVTNLATGVYRVGFAGFGNSLNSDVQISAVNYFSEGSPHYCTAEDWSSDGTNVSIDVLCFSAAGALANGDFALLYEARTTPPPSGYIAFAWADQPTVASYTPSAGYSYNSSGGAIGVTRTSVGAYTVLLSGAPARGSPMVTAYGGAAAHCEIDDWRKDRTAGVQVFVRCFNGAGQAADERYDIAYSAGVSLGDSDATRPGGYAWADQATAAKYKPAKTWQFNNISTEPFKGSNAGFGIGFLELPVVGRLTFQPYLGLITTVGSSGGFCDQSHIEQDTTKRNNPNFYLAVQCYDAHGNYLASEWTAAIIAHPVG